MFLQSTTSRTIWMLLATALAAPACGSADNSLEGSLSSQYNLEFDSVRVRQFMQSRQLHVEYIRGEEDSAGEEKPITVTISPTPDGPGSFDYAEREVNIDNSLAPGSPQLPGVTSATVDLTTFTPEAIDSLVEGSIHAMFTSSGEGAAFSLEGNFSAELSVVP